MRLLNTTTLQLETFHPPYPPYAILSHVHSPAELTPAELTTIATHRLRRQQELARIIPRSNGPDKADTMKLLLLQSMLLAFRGGSHGGGPNNHRPPTPPPIDAPVLASAFEKALVPASLHSSHVLELKPAFQKISLACGQAAREGLQWIWIDSVCVDRGSSAEVTEAVNSMWSWYAHATVCYAYLEDVQHGKMRGAYRVWKDDFVQSRWFKRGWTLQELLAPRRVVFYGAGWKQLGTKSGLVRTVEKASGVDRRTLLEPGLVGKASVARRMAWASGRSTSLPEDMAYCLMGLFGVRMVPMYGEGGEEAFGRLQEEIIKRCDDQTIFAWGILGEEDRPVLHHTEQEEFGGDEVEGSMSVLARSVREFRGMERVVCAPTGTGDAVDYGMTNKGVRIKLHMLQIGKGKEVESQGYFLAALDCRHEQEDPQDRMGIFLAATEQPNVFVRTRTKKHTRISGEDLATAKPRLVYISNTVGGFVADGGEEEKLFIKAGDLISPGYDIIDAQAKQWQWNKEFCTMRLAGVAPLEPGSKHAVVYQLAVLMFFNRHLKSGLCVRIIVDQASNECFVDLVPPPDPRTEEEKRKAGPMTPEEEDDEELNQLRGQARKLWENPGRVNLQRTKIVGNKKSMYAQTVDLVNPELIGMEDEDDMSVARFKMTPDGPPQELRPGVIFKEKWEKEYHRMVQATITRKKRGVISLDMSSMLFAAA